MQDEAELVGDRALAGGPVGGELALVQLDEVLGLAAGAVDIFIEMARLSAERGNDVAGVEAPRGGLQPGDDPAFAVSRTGGVVEGVELRIFSAPASARRTLRSSATPYAKRCSTGLPARPKM